MAKKNKQTVQLIDGVDPGLFGQKYSSRDYRYEDSWGKNQFNSSVNSLSYKYKTDKAFAISGKLTNPFLKSAELEAPRISKFEIKNIILGDGQKLLRPERRFDAYLVSHPELFK